MTAQRTRPITVLVADDQPVVRSGFRFFLDAQPDITVVAEAADGREALVLAAEHRPDVALLDIRMPYLDGLAATAQLTSPDNPHPTKVVVATTFDLDEYVYTALGHGASGFILKDAGPVLLAEAVRAAANGDSLISPAITVRLLKHLAGGDERHRPVPNPLTGRETDVLKLVAAGHTNAEVAAQLYISLSSVKTHLAHIQQRLGVRNRVEIAAWAWRHGHH